MVVIADLALLTWFVAAAWGAGVLILPRIAGPGHSAGVRAYLSLNLGFAVLSMAVFLFGIPRLVTPVFAVLLLGVFSAAGLVSAVAGFRRAGSVVAAWGRAVREAPLASAALCVVTLAGLGGGLNPEVRGDPIIYHISEALLFAVHRGHIEVRSSALTYIPQHQQLLYALVLTLSGDVAAKLLHWFSGVMLLGGAALLVRRLGGSPGGAMRAAALLALVPIWMYLATAAYVDFPAANAILAGLLALMSTADAPTLRVRAGLCAVAGAMFGAAMGCKYTAALVGFLPAFLLFPVFVRGTARQRLACAAMLVAGAALLFAPWLIRNAMWTGNPVAPTWMRVLGPPGVPEATLAWPDIQAGNPAALWPPDRLLAAYGDMAGAFSDYLNFLPVLAALAGVVALAGGGPVRRAAFPPQVRHLLAFVALAFLIGVPLAAVRRDARYVMAHMAVLAAILPVWTGVLSSRFPDRGRQFRLVIGATGILLAGSWLMATRNRFADLNESLWPRWTAAQRDQYQRGRLEGFDANRAISGRVPQGDGLILGAAYPARVPYVLGGAPLTSDFSLQRPDALTTASIAALRRQGVGFVFGRVKPEVAAELEAAGEFGGVPLWRLPRR